MTHEELAACRGYQPAATLDLVGRQVYVLAYYCHGRGQGKDEAIQAAMVLCSGH